MRDLPAAGHRGAVLASLVLSLLPLLGGRALAQENEGLANVLGRVVQSGSRAPLEDAVVELPDLEMSMPSDETGRFWFRNIAAGDHTFIVRYLGFTDSARVFLVPNELNQLEIGINLRIVPVADRLVEVDALAAPGKLTGFNRRRENGQGYYITREDILRRDPVRTTDMLRSVPGVRIGPNRIGQSAIRMRGRDCNIAYYIDGIRAPNFDLDNVSPQDIAGIEVYKGTSSVPPEFRGSYSYCAAIVLWTRDPSLP